MDGEPTEELDAITGEIPLAPELRGDLPMESERENNGPPLMWLGVAVVLLVGAVAAIVWIGQNRDEAVADDAAVQSSLADEIGGVTTAVTPPVGDPAAGAAGDGGGTTADTSPPDEGAATTDTSAVETSSSETTVDDAATTSTAAPAGPAVFVDGLPEITTTTDDFEIAVSTLVCTTIEWSFTGEGQSASYSSEQLCFDDHLLSPRPEHPLLPGTTYQVTAIFSAEGTDQVLVLEVLTEG